MSEAVKEILELKEDCDYKRISVDEILVLKDYIQELEKYSDDDMEIMNKQDELILDLHNQLIEKERKINELQDKNERLHNIIKEVREYAKEHIRIDDEYPDYMEMLIEEYDKLLEILDKEGKDNE